MVIGQILEGANVRKEVYAATEAAFAWVGEKNVFFSEGRRRIAGAIGKKSTSS